MKKLNHLLLVDDDPTTIFFNRHLIGKMGVFKQIHVANNGKEALEKIEELRLIGEVPDLILLDINMPVMNGFEFLDYYGSLPPQIKSPIVVCMLTTSLANSDLEKSKQYDLLSDYIDKPLYEDRMIELINKHFSE